MRTIERAVTLKTSAQLVQTCTMLLLVFNFVFAAEPPTKITYATHDQDWYPIDYRDDTGQFIGIFEDIFFELFENKLNLQTEIIRQPWNRSQMDVRNGKADMLITVPTSERLEYTTQVPTPFFSIEFHLLIPKNHPKYDELSQVSTIDEILQSDITLVSTFGNGWYESTVKAAGVKTEYVKTDEQQIKFLLAGRADALIDFPVTMEPLLNKLDKNNQLVFTNAIFSKTDLHILVGKQSHWSDFVELINDALVRVQEDPGFSASQFK